MGVRGWLVAAGAVGAIGLTGVAGAEPTGWVHVEVHERGEEAARVMVNLPLGALDLALSMADKKHEMLGAGKLRLGQTDMSVADLRKLWSELRAGGDADLARIEKPGESVLIRQEGSQVLIRVDKEGDEKVSITVPAAVVDALLSGSGEELDVKAAIGQLQSVAHGDLVRVEDGKQSVRIWID